MNIIVIGCKGFIGSHVFAELGKRYSVWGCDVFTDYNEKNFFLIQQPSSDFQTVFRKHKFDICINCSGAASVPDSFMHPARDFELNAHNVFLLLETIREFAPQCKIINLSSAAVYGNPKKIPTPEQHDLAPVSPYGVHKFFAEGLCSEYSRFFKIDTCNLRIFSAFGPGLKKQIFWDLYCKSKISKAIELFGTGTETRDFIYVTDIAKAIDTIIQKGTFAASIYNVAGGEAWPISKAAQIFLDAVNWKGTLKFSGNHREGDPDFWRADVTKIRELGFTPSVKLEEGILKYAKWLSSLE